MKTPTKRLEMYVAPSCECIEVVTENVIAQSTAPPFESAPQESSQFTIFEPTTAGNDSVK